MPVVWVLTYEHFFTKYKELGQVNSDSESAFSDRLLDSTFK